MSFPNPSVKKTSQSKIKKKPNPHASAEHASSATRKQQKKNLEAKVKTNEPTEAIIDLPPLVPTDNNPNEKNPKTIKIIRVSSSGIQPIQDIPKLIQSNTLSTNIVNMPKLRMINNESEKAPAIKQTPIINVSTIINNKLPARSPLILRKSSGIPPLHVINKPNTSKTVPPVSTLNNVATNPDTSSKPKPAIAKPNMPSEKVQKKPILQGKLPNNKLSETSSAVKPETKTEKPKESNDGKRRQVRKSCKRDNNNRDESTSKIENIYIADGLREDCENLVEKCLQVFKLNFEKFCEIWKQMNFPCMYHGRQSGAEIAELSEEAIHIAKAHMVAKNVNFEENVAGLFLVYAFLNHQPYKEFAALRLVPADVPSVLHLETEARKQRRYDVLYILGSVLIKGPCQYHVLPREVALEMPIRKYHDGSVQMSGPHVESVFTKTSKCVQYLKQAIALDQKYAAIRQKIREKHGAVERVRSLSSQCAADLFAAYREHVPGGVTFNRDLEAILKKSRAPQAKEENRQDLVRSIKQRAMANVVDPMRHLTGVGERQQDNSFSSPESETEKAPKSSSRCKGKGKGKGRSSAQTLQNLFAEEKPKEYETPPPPSQKAMPTLDVSENLFTVNHTPKSTPKKRMPPLSFNADDKPLNKRTKPVTKLTEKKPIQAKTDNLEKDNSAIKEKDEKVHKPAKNVVKAKRKSKQQILSDFKLDSGEIDNIPIDVLAHRNPIKKTKLDRTNKSQILDEVKKVTTYKSKTKNIKIKAIEIIKPADDCNSKEILKEETNIRLESMPVEIHSADKNIEIEIIDNLKEGIRTLAGNEAKEDNEGAISKKELINDISCISKKSITKKAETSIFDVSKMLNTEQIDARFQRRKRRESRKIKNRHTVEVFHDLSSEYSETSDESDEINKPDPNMPSTEELETISVRRERRDQKRLRIKSTFKKMGILEVANLKKTEEIQAKRNMSH